MTCVGIDPGLDGAVAILGADVRVYDTPTCQVGRREYIAQEMSALLAPLLEDGPVYVTLELVHAMPGQGVTSMWRMGYGSGLWEGILAALGVSYERVAPQTWKRAMLRDMARDKDAARLKAMQLFPQLAGQLSRKKDHGRAEALLLAEYGRRVLGNATHRVSWSPSCQPDDLARASVPEIA